MSNKCVLITGSSHGIGQATAVAFAEAGYDVGVNYGHDQKGAEETAALVRQRGMRAEIYQADVTSSEACENMVNQFVKDFGKIDVLINNAGGILKIPEGEFEDIPIDYWNKQVDLNLNHCAYCARTAVKHMKAQGINGAIINISSLHSQVTFTRRKCLPYCAAKAGVNMFTASLGSEVAKYGIRVNCVIPGLILTPTTRGRYDERMLKLFSDRIPAGRPGEVEDITPLIVFLAEEKNNRFIVGQTFSVDGGYTIDGIIPGLFEE